MGIPDPPKRRELKAYRYLDELETRLRLDRYGAAQRDFDVRIRAMALILLAFFGEKERLLFRRVYEAHAGGECLDELRIACACEGQDQLCLILESIIAQPDLAAQLAEALYVELQRDDAWQAVATELHQRQLRAEDFVWWSFSADKRN